MYNCIIHGWSSFERKCPDCFPLIYTTASTTEPSPPSADTNKDYWMKRCEAAEAVIADCLSVDFALMNFPQKEFDLVSHWQDLKNNPTDKGA